MRVRTTREGQARVLSREAAIPVAWPWLVQHVRDEPVDELWREPCGFWRHDAARVRYRHDVAHLRRVQRHGRRHLAAADAVDEFIHPATAADIRNALIATIVLDAQNRLQQEVRQDADIQAAQRVADRVELGPETEPVRHAARVQAELAWRRGPAQLA